MSQRCSWQLIDACLNRLDSVLLERLRQVLEEFREAVVVPASGPTTEITEWMRALRGRSLDDRKQSYQRERIEDQRAWYAGKARWNNRRSVCWSVAMLGIQALRLAGADLAAGHGGIVIKSKITKPAT